MGAGTQSNDNETRLYLRLSVIFSTFLTSSPGVSFTQMRTHSVPLSLKGVTLQPA